uniref:WASH complex subunit 2-like n=1 Tax=Dermatophagoides pteronyssinus TaxID=6956 RepID=A0A6P6YCJ5_DERPT|nr:WASH complex subunit 2-like [Dermatophagoides pteronyssinus]
MSDNQDQERFESIDELEQNKSKWNLISDLKLLGLIKNTGDGFLNKIRQSLLEIDDLSYKTNTSANKINNLITSILILTNVKFIENRVYDEDIKDITSKTNNIDLNRITSSTTTVIQPTTKDDDGEEKQLINRLENSIDDALKRLISKYKISSEDFNENNSYNLLHKLYSQKNLFAHRNLPYIIGSDEYLKDTFVGMKTDDSHLDTVINLTNRSETLIDNNQDIIDHAANTLLDGYEEQKFQQSFSSDHNVDQEITNVPSTSKPFESVENLIGIRNHSNKDPLLAESSEDDDDIFVRPNLTHKPIVFDEPDDIDDDNLFHTASISSSHDGSVSAKDLPKQTNVQSENNQEKSKIQQQHSNNAEKILNFDDDSDEDDIFSSSKISRKSALKTTLNQSIFSSDDDDDDDLFNQLISKVPNNNKSEKHSDANSLIINEIVDDSVSDPILISTGKIQSKSTFSSNMIKELNSVLQSKVLSSEQTTTIPSSSSSAAAVSIPEKKDDNIQIIDTKDELNSMLKHKASLGSNRQRKPPTRNALKASLSNSQSLFNDDVVEDKNLKKPNSPITKEPDRIIITNEKIEPKMPLQNSSHNNSVLPKTKSKSLFDSSDSDDDIFKGPNLLRNQQQKSVTTTKKTSILFQSESDDNDDELCFPAFQSSKLSKVPKIEEKHSENIKSQQQQTMKSKKKSIFDDDSDSDGKNID